MTAVDRRGSVARRLAGVVVAGAAVVGTLVACSGGTEGTVVAKARQDADDGCAVDGAVTGPVAVPVWDACTDVACWRLVLRDRDGGTAGVCVSPDEYDRTPVGAFWHGRTDR